MPLRVPAAVLRPVLPLVRRLVTNADLEPATQRRRLHLFAHTGLVPFGTRTEEVALAGVPCLRVTARGVDSEGHTAVHLHGGAYIAGSPLLAKPWAAAVSAAAGCTVLLPDYRLAPEHPYPAAVQDALGLWSALSDEGPAPALLGDSAGAGLALTLATRLRDGAGRVPVALGLVCPFLDLATERETNPDDVLLTRAWLAQGAAAYAGDHDPAGPELSPLRADLSGLPPVHVVSASHDTLAPDAHAVTALVRAAGGVVEHHADEGLWHDFPLQAGTVAAGDLAARRLGDFLRSAWHRPGQDG